MRALTWTLVLVSATLVVLGPTMALQELAAREEAEAHASLTGEPVEVDLGYRAPWRLPLFALVAAVGVLGSLVALRVLRKPRLRSVSGRLLGLLFAGMTLVDLAFLADLRAPHLPPMGRAALVVWVYVGGALLVAGSAARLDDVETVFGSDAPPPPLLQTERAAASRRGSSSAGSGRTEDATAERRE